MRFQPSAMLSAESATWSSTATTDARHPSMPSLNASGPCRTRCARDGPKERPKTRVSSLIRSCSSPMDAICARTFLRPSVPTCPVVMAMRWRPVVMVSMSAPLTPSSANTTDSLWRSEEEVPARAAASVNADSFRAHDTTAVPTAAARAAPAAAKPMASLAVALASLAMDFRGCRKISRTFFPTEVSVWDTLSMAVRRTSIFVLFPFPLICRTTPQAAQPCVDPPPSRRRGRRAPTP